ncbi:MAG: hypothetical protein LBG18_06065, partial [Mediterranea sp.]|nr:hypothetical protein [Mediterranea sp.]
MDLILVLDTDFTDDTDFKNTDFKNTDLILDMDSQLIIRVLKSVSSVKSVSKTKIKSMSKTKFKSVSKKP